MPSKADVNREGRWSLLWILTAVVVLAVCAENVTGTQSFTEEPSDTAVMIGESVVVLKCIVAQKAGIVLWFKDNGFFAIEINLAISDLSRYSFVGNTSAGEYNLQIQNVILEDDGEYYCQVTPSSDIPGIESRRARLIIQRIPSTVTLLPSDSILPIIAGVPTNLTCQANSANPVAVIRWLRAGSELPSTHQRVWPDGDPSGKLMNIASALTLSPLVDDHSIVYECEVSHMALSSPRRIARTLDVQHAPVVVVEASQSPIREDTVVIFRCVVDANPRRVTYSWTKNGEPIIGAEYNQVEILMTKDDHMGTVTCTATNVINSVSGSLSTPVLYGPRFLEVPVSVSVDEEAPAQMSCSADGNPTPTIKWTRTGSHATLSTMHVLQFDLIRESDVGTYICIATVPGFEPIRSYGRVDINAIPEVISPKMFKAKIGSKATLECFTKTKPDPYMVIWAWNGQELEEGTMGRFTSTRRELDGGILSELIIDKVKSSDFGHYNCTMINEVGNMSSIVSLDRQELDLIVWIIIAVIGTSALIFALTIICMLYCKRKWQRRKKANLHNKGKVQLEIVRRLSQDNDDNRSRTGSYDYNATPPSTPGKPRYAEPYHFTRGRRDSLEDPHYRAPRHRSDDYQYDDRDPDRYPVNEYSEPFVRKRDADRISFHSDRSEDYARRDRGDDRYDDDDMHDSEVRKYNARDPRFEDDTRSDSRLRDDRSYDDNRSYDNRQFEEDYSYSEDRRGYSTEGSLKGSDISQATKNKLATNV